MIFDILSILSTPISFMAGWFFANWVWRGRRPKQPPFDEAEREDAARSLYLQRKMRGEGE